MARERHYELDHALLHPSNPYSLKKILIFLVLAIYQCIADIYAVLPFLLGILLYLLYTSKIEKYNILAFLYLLLFEVNQGFTLLSVVIYFLILLNVVIPFLEQKILCKVCLPIILVALSYFGFYGLNVFGAYLNGDSNIYNYDFILLFYYFIIESLIILVVYET